MKDYSKIAQETLVCIRNSYSQEQLNRKIKAHSNQIGRWEAGHAKIEWSVFSHLCQTLNIDLSNILNKHLIYTGDIHNGPAIISYLGQSFSLNDLSKKLNLSVSQVSRLLNGKSKVTLDHVFQFIDISSYSLIDLITSFTSPNYPAFLKTEQEKIQQEKNIHYERPWIAALNLFLKVYESESRNTDDIVTYLHKKLNISPELILKNIHQLLELNLIEKTSKGYLPVNQHLSLLGSREGTINIAAHWSEKCTQRLKNLKPGSTDLIGYKLYNICSQNREQFKQLYLKFHADLDSLIKQQNQSSDEVHLFLSYMINLDEESNLQYPVSQ